MALATEMYGSKENTAYIQKETTACTANVTTMYEIPLVSPPSIAENTYRDMAPKHGVGRTIKENDVRIITKGKRKEISFQMYLEETIYQGLLENGAGKVVEATGEILITYNHTPSSVGNGDTDTDWTGLMTFAWVPPFASEAQVFPGCACESLKLSMQKGSEGGRAIVDVTLVTQEEILTDQATPSSTVAYTISDKTIYDLCDTATVNAVDVQLEGFEITHNFNVKTGGLMCDGGASSYGKNIPNIDVDGVVTCLVDSNMTDTHKLPRAESSIAIELNDGSDFYFIIAQAFVSEDVQATDNEDYQIWTIPFKATASTSGNILEEQVA